MADKIVEPTIGLGEDIEAFGYKQELKRGLQLRDVILYGVLFMVIIAPQSIYGEIPRHISRPKVCISHFP